MSEVVRWQPGQPDVWRWGDVSGPHSAETVTVVRDDETVLAVWPAAGTPVLRRRRTDGVGRHEGLDTMFTAPVVRAVETWECPETANGGGPPEGSTAVDDRSG